MGAPVSRNAFQTVYGGRNTDGVVLKLNVTGTHLLAATYLGGNGEEYIQSLALDHHLPSVSPGATCFHSKYLGLSHGWLG